LVKKLFNELPHHYWEHSIVYDFVPVLAILLLTECLEVVSYVHADVSQKVLVNVHHFAAIFSLNVLGKLFVYFLHLFGIQIRKGHLIQLNLAQVIELLVFLLRFLLIFQGLFGLPFIKRSYSVL
jgi:hypothetical protein